MERFGIHSENVLIGDELTEATVIIENGKIGSVIKGNAVSSKERIEDVGESIVMPGLIDCHVHINEPGRTEWEGFETATKAAAAGGITSLIEMPLNSDPVTTTKTAFKKKLEATEGKLHVNCGFYGGVVPGNVNDLEELIDAGVFGIKAFLCHSGIDEFPNVTETDLRKGLPILKKHNLPLLVHAELVSAHKDETLLNEDQTSYQAYLRSRPKKWEDDAIEMMIKLCREFDTPIHIVHLSSANSIEPLKMAIADGLPISVETCPQYLYFNAEDIPDADTRYKCAPPIREKANNEQLWQALKEDLFSFVVTDHSPAIPEIKEIESGNLAKAWGGIAGLQFSLSAIWTKAKARGIGIPKIAKLMSTNVAEFLGLENSKGRLAAGYDADIVVWNPEATFTVNKGIIEFRHKVTPYEGETLIGVVQKTYVGGHKVYDSGHFMELVKGKVLKRNGKN